MERILIDTSVWITFFRGKEPGIVDEVASLLKRGAVVVTGLVLTELVQGALNEKEIERILTLLEPVDRIDPSTSLWEEAGRLSYDLRKKGVTTATVDALLAALAITNDCSLYSEDRHFELIAKHTDLRLHAV